MRLGAVIREVIERRTARLSQDQAGARKVKMGERARAVERLSWSLPMKNMQWARLFSYVTGMVNRRLLLQNEYLAAENRILRANLPARLRLTNPERSTLAEIGKRIGRKALQEVACVAKPDTILAWYRRLIARKFDGSTFRQYPGSRAVGPEVVKLVLRLARENASWGYDCIAGAMGTRGSQALRQFGRSPNSGSLAPFAQ